MNAIRGLGATIHERDNVLEVATHGDVIDATAAKRFEPRGDEERRCGDSNVAAGDQLHLDRFDRRLTRPTAISTPLRNPPRILIQT